MNSKKFTIAGVGCALADYLYTSIHLNSHEVSRYRSRVAGDGGLDPGNLVFTDDLEEFAGSDFRDILRDLAGNRKADGFSIGGPSIVSLIHAAQLLSPESFNVRFYGATGNDETGARIRSSLKDFPLITDAYKEIKGMPSPYTYVLSDPGSGASDCERTFINTMGAATAFSGEMLDDLFFQSKLVCFGGTALVPRIHDDLHVLLKKVKDEGGINLVNTVFDFRNEKLSPGKPWPLGDTHQSLELIDALIMNSDEALKISGKDSLEEASEYFIAHKLGAFFITGGKHEVLLYSGGDLFLPTDGMISVPVSERVKRELEQLEESRRDTTGCGDNFAGGIIVSLASQLQASPEKPCDIMEAVSWGVASGGFACLSMGGAYRENIAGEKRQKVEEYRQDYMQQLRF